nr:LuxR C-terminal-related transcriptional regulator [Mesobacterium pallidum]
MSVAGLRAAPLSWHMREMLELGAVVGLVLGAGLAVYAFLATLRREEGIDSRLRVASGAFMDLLEDHFTDWGLTAAERDVALFMIKGLSIAEIAALRATSPGTVKAQNNAIYRKAGVSGRAQLLSLFIDDLIADALPGIELPAVNEAA